ncbi:hypothetical protein M3Y96_00351300 [Aphelenchoides besseyi]|nr:hypothetical protein M3Y96_00351300 [Aphelenchoides besseyi]
MFFITKVYESRFNDNMNRHRILDKKIAPAKPKPNTRNIHRQGSSLPKETGGDIQILNRFLEYQSSNVSIESTPSSTPPPMYNEIVKPNSMESPTLENKKPVDVVLVKPPRRVSFDSAIGSNGSLIA